MADVLRVEDLRRVCGMLLDAAEKRFGAEVDLSGLGVDHYWNVDLRSAFELAHDPAAAIDVGQSSDDVAELRALLRTTCRCSGTTCNTSRAFCGCWRTSTCQPPALATADGAPCASEPPGPDRVCVRCRGNRRGA
ncbi:hypothetical protein [Micromonospora globbae]|uniref:hypothetical protein n=1 Tax=Micromonospora globbae TaxID=1894969 RepID=UPI001F0241AA|nr:hypothetical protein [Micromonospora globbae]